MTFLFNLHPYKGLQSVSARLLLSVLTVLGAIFYAPHTLAHATLLHSEPPSQAVLSTAPKQIQLNFNEAVAPLRFSLLNPDGKQQALTEVDAHNHQITVTLPPTTTEGSYLLSWRVISADSHPVGGTVQYAFGHTTTVSTHYDKVAAWARFTLIFSSAFILSLALFFGLGRYLYLSPASYSRPQPPTLLLIGVLAALLSVGAQGLDMLDLPLSALMQWSTWSTGLYSHYGLSAVCFCVVLCLALYHRKRLWTRISISVTALLYLTAFLSSGHAVTADLVWFARLSVGLHVSAVLGWLGALVPLLQPAHTLYALQRFHRFAPYLIGTLLLSGGCLLWLQTQSLNALPDSPYGKLLIAKLLIVISLLALGAWNRYQLSPQLLKQSNNTQLRLLRRSVRTEIVLACLVLAIVSGWRFTPPPRAHNAQHHHTLPSTHTQHLTLQNEKVHATLQLHYDASALQHVDVNLLDTTGAALSAQALHLNLRNDGLGVENIRYDATADGTQWRINTLNLPPLTQWQLQLEVLISDFERTYLSTNLELIP